MSKTIEITVDLAREILPGLEERLVKLRTQRMSLEDQIGGLGNIIAEIRTKLNGDLLHVKDDGEPRRRLRKGEGDKRVFELMSNLPPHTGLALADVAKRAGVPVSTAYRTLKYRYKDKFTESKGLWSKKG